MEQCQNKCGTDSRAKQFGNVCDTDETAMIVATTEGVLMELSSSLTPSITLKVFVGIYATGLMAVPITAAMGTAWTVTASELTMVATGLLIGF